MLIKQPMALGDLLSSGSWKHGKDQLLYEAAQHLWAPEALRTAPLGS